MERRIPYGSPISPKGVMAFSSFAEPLSPIKAPHDFFKTTKKNTDQGEILATNRRTFSEDNQDEEAQEDSIHLPKTKSGTVGDGNNAIILSEKDCSKEAFLGSTAFHTYLKIQPCSDTVLMPMLRAVLDMGGDPTRPWEALVDDILVNQLHFVKAAGGTQENIYCGHIQGGHRVVAAPLFQSSGGSGTHHNSSIEDWIVACADANTAAHFVLLLRSLGMEVQQHKET